MTEHIEHFQAEMEDFSSAEEFLDLFDVDYDREIVQVNRLHILQRFHNYLTETTSADKRTFFQYQDCLKRAYQDFTDSTALEQKVLRVFQKPAAGFVSLDKFE